jgi:hypothetical protein
MPSSVQFLRGILPEIAKSRFSDYLSYIQKIDLPGLCIDGFKELAVKEDSQFSHLIQLFAQGIQFIWLIRIDQK